MNSSGVNLKFHHDTISYLFFGQRYDICWSHKSLLQYDFTLWLDTGAWDRYEMMSYFHLTQSVTFISSHKKQQKHDLTVLLLNSYI